MKKNKILGWFAALAIITGTCIYAQANGWGGTHMNTSDDMTCSGSLYICATVED